MERKERTGRSLPLFVGAVVLLVVNDHLLKGSGWLPGWLTGKLSDFAGLLVAPPLAVWLLRPRTQRTRALVFALPVVAFLAINLVPAAARSAEAWMSFARWTVWADPTDAIALLILPLAWRIASERPLIRVGARRVWATRLAIATGALACIATSTVEPFYSASAFVVNHTGEAVDLRVRHLGDVSIDCEAIAEGEAALALAPELFTDAVTYAIEPNGVVPLDALDDTATDERCRAAILEMDGMEPQLAFWTGFQQWTELELTEDRFIPDHGVRLTLDDTRRPELTPLSIVELMPTLDRIDEVRCPHEAEALQWSGDIHGWARLASVEGLPGGCTQLTSELGTHLYVCAPEWAFPFAPGEEVTITNGSGQLVIAGEWANLTLSRVGATFAVLPADASVGCLAERTECGAYVQPRGWQYTTDAPLLAPGQSVELPMAEGDTERVTVALGVSEQVIVGSGACAPDRRTSGPYQETLVLRERVEGLE